MIDEYSSGGNSHSGGLGSGFGSSSGSGSSSNGRRESFGDKIIDKAAEFAKKKW